MDVEQITGKDADLHKKLGIELFNYTWELLDKPQRTREEADTMIHAAHASRFHWEKGGGTAVNLARGEWQVSRVYAVLERAEAARYHGQRCLELCQENGIADFDLAFAYEALARAASSAGDKEERDQYLALAQEAAQQIAEKGDRDLVLHDLETV
jgi:hypothetical protein